MVAKARCKQWTASLCLAVLDMPAGKGLIETPSALLGARLLQLHVQAEDNNDLGSWLAENDNSSGWLHFFVRFGELRQTEWTEFCRADVRTAYG